MQSQIDHKCSEQSTPDNCPDRLVNYSPMFNEYGLIVHDGGSIQEVNEIGNVEMNGNIKRSEYVAVTLLGCILLPALAQAERRAT